MEETTENPQYPLMTLEMARGYLARAVLTQGPDFVYQTVDSDNAVKSMCYYKAISETALSDDPRCLTGCIVGVAMTLAEREITDDHEGDSPDSMHLRRAWNLTVRAGKYLYLAQSAQDNGSNWGDAYKNAESNVSRIIADYEDH